MSSIVAELSPLFAELGEFHGGTTAESSRHGYLQLREMPQLTFIPPSCSVGQSRLLAQGKDAAHWRRIGNEVQMQLHALPLNAQREADGRPTLNSLWFWGAGQLPERTAQRYTQVSGSTPLLKGLARWSETTHAETPAHPDALLEKPSGKTLLLLDALQTPVRQHDAQAWREALVALDRLWLQALRRALLTGRLDSLRITALGDEASLDIRLSRGDMFKFWRRPQALVGLSYPQSSA